MCIAVIGAGVAGSVTALVAARAGRRVVLIDGGMPSRPVLGETLPPEAGPVLQGLGLWQAFLALPKWPCWANWSAWGNNQLHAWEHLRNPHGCAWHVSRPALEAMLRAAAVEAGAQLLTGTARVEPALSCRVVVRTRQGAQALEAAYLVDATGRRATIARAHGGRRVQYDRLVGVVRTSVAADVGSATLVESAREGWWFSASTPARRIMIFLSDADLVASHGIRYESGWNAQLAAAPHTRARAMSAELWAPPAVVAASTSRLEPIVGSCWVAVGDSSATYDPLGSYGILHSLESGRQAAIAIDAALWNDPAALPAYETMEQERFHEHLGERRAYYRIEQRWRTAPFWRRRVEDHEPTAEGAGSRGGARA